MRVTALMENTAGRPGVVAEHGLSLLVETGSHVVLFDMGQSGAFASNAAVLGVDLSQVDVAVISHGHYDHGGGLPAFLELNDHASIYVNRRAFEEHRNAAGKGIGLDPALAGSDRLVYVDDHLDLGDGLELFSCNDRRRTHGTGSVGFTAREGGRLVPDAFLHEHYLLVTEQGRKVLFSGCSHKGILDIEGWFEPDVLVGGFHFMRIDVEGDGRRVLDDAARELMGHRTAYFTCHCTGLGQYRCLKAAMADQLGYLACGQTVEV
ncbi:MAG: MBL fold metallo-hydrolase [Atopobiaceae bacterium]|jgi:7,8-dihydropterin-6-yl-methyl-4-(beta-D-ribofuranosyl)aminobenzene 5'-phosphate synthase|nr:MBL fold metallo-hydrolase [Atopobiaceae bacterium]